MRIPGFFHQIVSRETIVEYHEKEMQMTEKSAKSDNTQKRSEKLQALRSALRAHQVDGFVVPKTDAHLGEFIPEASERLQWLTGFTGSMGLVMVLADHASIFVDGRYTLQVRKQADPELFEPLPLDFQEMHTWLGQHLQGGQKLAYDPWLHAQSFIERLETLSEDLGITLVPLASNPIDHLWKGQPALPATPAVVHPLTYAGQKADEKIKTIAKTLKSQGADATVLNALDSVNWLLNFRGDDSPTTPVALCFAIVTAQENVMLFIDSGKLTDPLKAQLKDLVTLHPYGALDQVLGDLSSQGLRFLLDPQTAPARLFQILTTAKTKVIRGPDPCLLPKACKNAIEIRGAKEAHIRDGVAVTSFLAWLHRQVQSNTTTKMTEIQAAEKLLSFRAQQKNFKKPSFESISSAGPNGAIVHYNPYTGDNRALQKDDVYLIDSGGQYLEGTTDVTRAVVFQPPTPEQKDRFTRVLKGHIALARVRFPEGTSGGQLDALARAPLWEVGLDYAHGTGHGVGSYLGVHEGPQSISSRPNGVALRPGMICSNEPGYYKAEAYGFRIESLVVVVTLFEASEISESSRSYLGFETLTLVPIDLNLVEETLLTRDEISWLNAYHQRVRDTLMPLVDHATATWLEHATRPVR